MAKKKENRPPTLNERIENAVSLEAAKYIIANNYTPRIIYTDSMTAIAWFQAKRTASKKAHPALKRAEIFLKAFTIEIDTIELKYWDNGGWGETPADFGEK